MQQKRYTLTVNNLLAIFSTTRTSLYQRLNQNNLKSKLSAQHHIIKIKNRPYFDNYAFIQIAKKFENRRIQKRSKSQSSNRTSYSQSKQMIKKLNKIISNQDKIINKLNITY